MVIGFKPQFVEPILKGIKKHTFREDKKQRWLPGMIMHQSTGVRTKNYNCFYTPNLISKQKVKIEIFNFMVYVFIDNKKHVAFSTLYDWSDDGKNGYNFLETLAKNDGFSSVEDFLEWFRSGFDGYILHWTDLKY